MGMDVIGKDPESPKGEYFRNNVWSWRPLWDYCLDVGGDIIPADGVMAGQFNDCWGLDAEPARKLGRRLHDKLNTGHTKKYAAERKHRLDNLPDEACSICGGTGRRAAPPKTGPGTMPCNGCRGTGKSRPWATEYPFAEDNVREFADFLEDSGGFEIC